MKKDVKESIDKYPVECLEADYDCLWEMLKGYAATLFNCVGTADEVKLLTTISHIAEEMAYMKKRINKEIK